MKYTIRDDKRSSERERAVSRELLSSDALSRRIVECHWFVRLPKFAGHWVFWTFWSLGVERPMTMRRISFKRFSPSMESIPFICERLDLHPPVVEVFWSVKRCAERITTIVLPVVVKTSPWNRSINMEIPLSSLSLDRLFSSMDKENSSFSLSSGSSRRGSADLVGFSRNRRICHWISPGETASPMGIVSSSSTIGDPSRFASNRRSCRTLRLVDFDLRRWTSEDQTSKQRHLQDLLSWLPHSIACLSRSHLRILSFRDTGRTNETVAFVLLGDLHGLAFPNGTRLSTEQINAEFVQSWRVTPNTSLFEYFDQPCSRGHSLYTDPHSLHCQSISVTAEPVVLP